MLSEHNKRVVELMVIFSMQERAIDEAINSKVPFTYLPTGAGENAQWLCSPYLWDPFDWMDDGIDPMTGVDLR